MLLYNATTKLNCFGILYPNNANTLRLESGYSAPRLGTFEKKDLATSSVQANESTVW